jgi:hypothetical protein
VTGSDYGCVTRLSTLRADERGASVSVGVVVVGRCWSLAGSEVAVLAGCVPTSFLLTETIVAVRFGVGEGDVKAGCGRIVRVMPCPCLREG